MEEGRKEEMEEGKKEKGRERDRNRAEERERSPSSASKTGNTPRREKTEEGRKGVREKETDGKRGDKKRALVGQDCRLKRLNQRRERPEMGKRRRWKRTKREIHVNSFSLHSF